MNIILAILGALIAGTIWHFGGAVIGAIVGWLCGRVHELGLQQQELRRELSGLRDRLPERKPQSKSAPEPAAPAPAQAMPDTVELTMADLVVDNSAPPINVKSVRKQVPRSWPNEPDWNVREPVEPSPPSAFEEWLGRMFSAENLLVKLGVIILFIGVSFLVKYAAQHGLFPLELRLTAAALGGSALLGVGWKLREERPVYAQVIQGGGVGILYLTTYAAMRLYHLIPVTAGFGILVTVCVLAGYLAVAQNSRSMAVLGSAGGFLAPELASLGSGSHVILFTYYTVLNLGVLGIARYRTWRELNLVGFIGTFIVGAFWGCRFYQPAYFFSLEPFLLLFFLIYALLPVLQSRFEPTELDGFVDMGLVFGTPIIAFVFQQQLVQRFEYGLAWSSLALGAFYLVLSGRLLRAEPQRLRNLAEAFLALGVLFATLTIPLALDGRWTAAAWSVEGAALIWAGLRQQRLLARLAGYLLVLGSGIAFAATIGMKSGPWPVLNSFYIGCLLEAFAGLYCARLLARQQQRFPEQERLMENVLFAWGMIWWFSGGLHEIGLHTVASQLPGAQLLFVALSCLACELLQRRLAWRLLSVPAFGLLPAMGFLALMQLLAVGKEYIGLVRVATSDDLQHWQDHACGALAILTAGTQQLNRSRIEFPAVKSRYFRLTASPEEGMPVITAVTARLESLLAVPGRATARYFITPVKGQIGDYMVQTGGRMPVDRVRLVFEEVNSFAGATFFSRTDNKSSWIERGSSTFYRLRRDSSMVESASLEIAPAPDREWLIRIRQPGGAPGERLPMFEVGWQPHKLIFAARGEPPFRLAFGSARIGVDNMRDDSIAAGLATWEKQQIKPLQAFAGASVESGGRNALRPTIPATTWRKLLLWGALLSGVILLARMAWKLSREMGLDDAQKKASGNERPVIEKGGEAQK